MDKRTKVDLLIIIVFLLVISLPFINKAFHIDDQPFIKIAEKIKEHPIDPYYGITGFFDKELFWFTLIHSPPLLSYFLTPFISLTERPKEPVLHLACLLFTLLAGISFYFLAKRFTPPDCRQASLDSELGQARRGGQATKSPLFATLFLVSTPAFIVSSHSVMADVPLLALCMIAITTYIYGLDNNSQKLLILSGIMLGLASLTGYIALSFFPLLLTYAVLQKKLSWKAIFPLIIGGAIFSPWIIQNYIFYGVSHLMKDKIFLQAVNSLTLEQFVHRGVSNISAIGGVTIFPVAILAGVLKNKSSKVSYICCLMLTIFLCTKGSHYLKIKDYILFQRVLLIFFLSTGLFAVYKVFEKGLQKHIFSNSDNFFLVLWFGGVLIATILFLYFGCARRTLLLLPPLIIIFTNEINILFRAKVFRKLSVICIFLATLTGIAIAVTDYEWAGIYRKFVKSLSIQYLSPNIRNQVWFTGEWGFKLYMQEAGASFFLSENAAGIENDPSAKLLHSKSKWKPREKFMVKRVYPKEGNIIVVPTLPCPGELGNISSHLILIREESYLPNLPIRLMSLQANAGFYSEGTGLLPYSFSTAELEHLYIYRVGDISH